MKTLFCGALAALALVMPITSACAARSESLGLTAPDGTYAVAASGLTADNQKAVQEAIQKIADVKDVAIDAAKGTISVTMKGDAVLKEAAVAEALKASGGAVTSFTAPADQEVVWMMTYSGGGG